MPNCHSTACAMSPVCVRVPMRLAGLDRLRGLAVVLMVADHVLVAAGGGGLAGTTARLTATRASLPLFCLVTGALVGPAPRWGRLAWIGAAGCVATLLGAPVGIGQPDVLLLLALALVAAPAAGRLAEVIPSGRQLWPVLLLVVAVVQPTTWPIPWTGYQPGTVVALVVVGQLVGRTVLDSAGRRLPAVLARAGRRPLVVYVGHLAILGGVLWTF